MTPPSNLGFGPGLLGKHAEEWLHHPDRNLIIWLRIPNVLLGGGTILMSFAVGRRVTRDIWTPVVAAALVAFMPRFLFLTSVVTNDNLVTLLGAVLTWCAVTFIQRRSWPWMVATGGVFGLLVTTKLSALPLGAIVLVLALSAASWRRRASLFAYGTLAAFSVSSWYLIQNLVRYGDPLARQASSAYLEQIAGLGEYAGVPYVVKNPLTLIVVSVPHLILSRFWYASGWLQFHWSDSLEIAISCVVGIVLIGLIGRHLDRWVLITLGAICVLALSCVWFVAFQTGTYQPRYAFVGLSAIAVVLALALERWRLPVRLLLPCAGLVGCLVAIHQDVLGVHWT